jgi:hypothetical protein
VSRATFDVRTNHTHTPVASTQPLVGKIPDAKEGPQNFLDLVSQQTVKIVPATIFSRFQCIPPFSYQRSKAAVSMRACTLE